jgi:tetratricopeptide (TPR) repeat protein
MGDLAGAIDTSEEILAVTPQDCVLWLQLGDANRGLSEFIKAEKGPEDPEVASRLDRSIAAYRKVTEVCPDTLVSYDKLGEIYFGSGKFTEAAEVYEQLLARDPSALDVASRLGFLYYKAEQWEKAIPVYQKLLEQAPDRQEDRKIYSTSLQKAKRYEEAAEQYQFLIDADKQNNTLYCNKAFLYIDADNGEKAIETAMLGLAANAPKAGCLNCAWGKGLELRAERLLQEAQFDRAISTYGEAKVKFMSAVGDPDFGNYAKKQLERIDQLIERAKQMKMKYEQDKPKPKAGSK